MERVGQVLNMHCCNVLSQVVFCADKNSFPRIFLLKTVILAESFYKKNIHSFDLFATMLAHFATLMNTALF